MKTRLSLLILAMSYFSLTAFALSAIEKKDSGFAIIEENGFKKSVEPMLTTKWSQDGGENCLLPFNSSAKTTQVKAGCGAVAMAQVMKYWNYPQHGHSFSFYVWDDLVQSGNKVVKSADFENTEYEWENMIDLYKGNNSATEEQKIAVGQLMHDIGVALEMKYKASSTATQIEYIHTALKKFYGYNPNMRLMRYCNGAYTMDEWLTMIYRELSEGRPVLMGGSNGSANHIFVADGYDEQGRIHLNLGHGGSGDKYYDLTKEGTTYNIDMRMIIGISPEELSTELTVANNVTPGNLKEMLGGDPASRRICRLKLTGSINNDDVSWLKELTTITNGQLSYLDLSECEIEGNKIPADAFRDSYTLQEIILPENLTSIGSKAFIGCYGLYKIELPQQLQSIENYAFNSCRYLPEITLPQGLRSLGTNPFLNSKVEAMKIAEGNTAFKINNEAIVRTADQSLVGMNTKWKGTYQVANGIKSIGAYAFAQCAMIDRLVLPPSLQTISSYAFERCYNVKDIYAHSVTAPKVNSNMFDSWTGNATLHVPAGCTDEYESKGWTMFASIVEDYGDIDGNGKKDITDLNLIIDSMTGETVKGITDINGDGRTDITDLNLLIDIICMR